MKCDRQNNIESHPFHRHIDCIMPASHYTLADGSCMRKCHQRIGTSYGSNLFNDSSIDINVNEYILKYPKVLNNLIKIMEKPCFYLKSIEEMEKEDDMRRDESGISLLASEIESYNNKFKLQIVVPRKDNVHLIK